MSETEILFFIVGWGIIIIFIAGRYFINKKKYKETNEKDTKRFLKFLKILDEVEEMKRKNKK